MRKVPISEEMKDSFVQFSRNGRWGTCVDCPRDSNGNAYPELCHNTDRQSHQLDVDSLAMAHKAHLPKKPVTSKKALRDATDDRVGAFLEQFD